MKRAQPTTEKKERSYGFSIESSPMEKLRGRGMRVSQRHVNRKKEADRKACRGKINW